MQGPRAWRGCSFNQCWGLIKWLRKQSHKPPFLSIHSGAPKMASRFKRLPGKDRRYLDTTTGIDISRRQYDNFKRFKDELKPKDIATKARQRQKQQRYQGLVDDFQTKQADKGVQLSKREIRNSEDFKSLFKQLNTVTKKQQKLKSGDTSPKTRKQLNDETVKLLTKLGRRDGIPGWVPVGFSDRFRKGKLKSPANLPKAYRFKAI